MTVRSNEDINDMEINKKKKVGAGFGVMILREDKILLGRRHIDPEKADSELRGGEVQWRTRGHGTRRDSGVEMVRS